MKNLTMQYLLDTLRGKTAKANHPITNLNPTKTFTIYGVKLEEDEDSAFGVRIFVRGENTCWFGQNIIEILD